VNFISTAVLSGTGNDLIDELELVTMPAHWNAEGGGADHADFDLTFTVTATLTATVSVTVSWGL